MPGMGPWAHLLGKLEVWRAAELEHRTMGGGGEALRRSLGSPPLPPVEGPRPVPRGHD